jgi:ABC-type multidrug transport system fused ATPase/permease subunit
LADKILVLKNGMLVEQGSHQELMNKGGEYMDLYLKQASMYENENVGVPAL